MVVSIDLTDVKSGQSKNSTPGLIYAVRVIKTGKIKIGFTRKLHRRLINLRSRYQSSIEVLGLVHGSVDEEKEFHKILAPSLAGDWGIYGWDKELYKPTEKVLSFVAHYLQSPESLGIVIPEKALHKQRNMEIYKLTPPKVEDYCNRITSGISHRAESRAWTYLKIRLRETANAGYDITPLLAIIKDRLGVDVEVAA